MVGLLGLDNEGDGRGASLGAYLRMWYIGQTPRSE